jgi:hypothetical protein
MDDLYFGAKYTIIDPTLTLSEFGLAVNPVVEVLSAGNPDGRVHFALPVNVELRRQPFRMYGSAGYFTRGSVFAGGALEWTGTRMIVTGSLTQSYSIKEDLMLDATGVRPSERERIRRCGDACDRQDGGVRERRPHADSDRGGRHEAAR